MTSLTLKEIQEYGSMIYEQISTKKSATVSKLASHLKISVPNTEHCLGVLREQGLVTNIGNIWCLPGTEGDNTLLEDSQPFSEAEGALCSRLEQSSISDDTRLKSLEDNKPDETLTKSYLDDLGSTHATHSKVPVQPTLRQSQISSTEGEDTIVKSIDNGRRSHSGSRSNLQREQISPGGSQKTIQIQEYGSMIYEQISTKKSATVSKLASHLKISVPNTEHCLGVLREQGLVTNIGNIWCLPGTEGDNTLLEDSQPFSEAEGALCSRLEQSSISDDTRLKSLEDNKPEETLTKSYLDDLGSTHATHSKVPVQPTLRQSQISSTEGEDTIVKSIDNGRRSHSGSRSNLQREQISPGGSQKTIRAGPYNLTTNAPVQAAYSESPDPSLQPHYEKILRIIDFFKTGESGIKPHEVARQTGLGSLKKDVNKILYSLEKKKILQMKCNENKGNPLWSAGEKINTCSHDMILECAAEVAKGLPTQKSAVENPGDVHVHHHHHHQHNTYLQVGQDNKLLPSQDPAPCRNPRSLPPQAGRKS